MDKIKEILAIVAFFLIVGMLAWLAFQNYQLKQQQSLLQDSVVKMKLLPDGTVRSETQFVTKDQLEALAKANQLDLKHIEEDLGSLGAELKGVGHLQVVTPGSHLSGLPSSSMEKNPTPPEASVPCRNGVCPTVDPYGYMGSAQTLKLEETFPGGIKVPFGSTTFKAWEEKPWSVDVESRTYSVDTVVGEDDGGKKYVYNKMKVKVDGKETTIPIESKFSETLPQAKFRFSPRFYLGMDVGVNVGNATGKIAPEAQPSLQISLFGYGKKALAPDLTLLNLGIGVGLVSHRPIVTLTPITYNIGQHIPLMTNLQIGPGIGLGTDGNVDVWVMGLKAGL